MTRSQYVGLTYPRFLGWRIWGNAIRCLWKKFLCKRHIHLLDECESLEHILHCDACGLSVHIALIETEAESCDRASVSLYIETQAIEKSERDSSHYIVIR